MTQRNAYFSPGYLADVVRLNPLNYDLAQGTERRIEC